MGINIPIPERLSVLLQEQEKVEFIEQPLLSSYQKASRSNITIMLIFLGIVATVFGSIGGNVFYALLLFGPMFSLFFVWNIYQLRKNYPKSFYAYTNMRLIYSHSTSSEVKFFYYKDIHDIKAEGDTIIIDNNDYTRSEHSTSKKTHNIIGVKDTESFVKVINEKLLPFRVPK